MSLTLALGALVCFVVRATYGLSKNQTANGVLLDKFRRGALALAAAWASFLEMGCGSLNWNLSLA